MTDRMDDGGPAFPLTVPDKYGRAPAGMSLLDYFAGQALAGLIVGCAGILGREQDGSPHFSAYAKGPCNAALSDRAYVVARAMLARRAALREDSDG